MVVVRPLMFEKIEFIIIYNIKNTGILKLFAGIFYVANDFFLICSYYNKNYLREEMV